MKNRQRQKDILFSILIFCSTFAVNLLIQKLFTTQTLVSMIFVFGVFLISLKTHGYSYGIAAAIASVFAVNFAFTYPYYVFDFFVEKSILSAVIMLVVAVSTSTLNIRIRDQEKLRSENEKERLRGNLLRAISHDLRTPLTSIYGSTSTLLSKYDALPKEQQLKLLGEIQEDSEWLIRMVENLLSVTRIDDAKVEVVKTPTVLDELIATHRFTELKGVIYFTDGQGIYPQKMPLYQTAFVFMDDGAEEQEVPPWAMKLVLDEEDLRGVRNR